MVWLTRIFTPHSRLFFGWRMVLAGSFAFSVRFHLPIEIAAVTLLVCVRKLQQSFTAHGQSSPLIAFRDFRLGVTDARVWIQAGFSTRKCLEEVSPKCAFVCFAHLVKSRAESTDALGHLRRKHFRWQRLLDLVPKPIKAKGSTHKKTKKK